MAKVLFISEDLLVEAPEGTPLMDIADAGGADITFACRSGSCGTCRIRVVEGLQNCSAMTSEEKDFLSGLGGSSDQRLACQIEVRGDVTVEYLGTEP